MHILHHYQFPTANWVHRNIFMLKVPIIMKRSYKASNPLLKNRRTVTGSEAPHRKAFLVKNLPVNQNLSSAKVT